MVFNNNPQYAIFPCSVNRCFLYPSIYIYICIHIHVYIYMYTTLKKPSKQVRSTPPHTYTYIYIYIYIYILCIVADPMPSPGNGPPTPPPHLSELPGAAAVASGVVSSSLGLKSRPSGSSFSGFGPPKTTFFSGFPFFRTA